MIVAFAGSSRFGKDTAADVLVTEYGFKKYHIAQKMKDCLQIIFGWDASYIENHKEERDPKYGVSPREVLRIIGTEFGQHLLCDAYPEFKKIVGRKLWVLSTLESIPPGEDAVIADMRFLHEEEETRKRGGIVIRIERPGYPVDLSHASEREIQEISGDFLFMNKGSLLDYQALVREFADTILFREAQ